MAEVVLVAAVAANGVIGRDNGLVFRHGADAKHFRDTTMGGPVVMGRKTWESLPARFRPLPGLHLGNPGALAFYRDLDELAVFDAHPANSVRDTEGVLLPIDLILVRAEPPLQAALSVLMT